jgi:predicted ATP-dependent protease
MDNRPDPSELEQINTLSNELSATDLFFSCNPTTLGFQTTDDLPDLEFVIGQPRAIRALELGSEVIGSGYNVFVLGQPGSGRTTLSIEYLQRKTSAGKVPDDWCYVNNFTNPHQPRALRLPPGCANEIRKDLQDLVTFCNKEIQRAFESEEYIHEKDRIVNDVKKNQEGEFLRLQEHVEKYKFIVMRTPVGIVLVPALDGKPIKPEDIEALSPDQRTKLEQLHARLSEEVEKTINHIREMARLAAEQLNQLNKSTALFVLKPSIDSLKEKFQAIPGVTAHLEAVQEDIAINAGQFRPSDGEESNPPDMQQWIKRYEVNVLVDNSETHGNPVVLESHPAYHNLLGRIEHEFIMGATRTDFTMIRPGALHRANGGYLVLPARDLLITPYAWDGLKRALKDGCIRVSELASELSLVSTVTLEPEPIPLEMKIILVGTPTIYHLLRAYDEDFAKLFKVRAEFTSVMDRSTETEHDYGLFVKSVVLDHQLPPFDASAIARIIEQSARMAEDQHKLSTRFGKISDLVRESAYWAKKDNLQSINAAMVQRSIDEAVFRSNLVEERIQEMISQGTLIIDLKGMRIGQINALSVMLVGDYAFGRPSKLTATVLPGRAGIVDIERQANLGGPLHTKGVLILSGFLGGRFAKNKPLNLSASLTFEQSYDEVEGDSASAAELLALLSAIAQVPLRQDRAITGSVNQCGQIQAIGGVNEKIEGFFETCKAAGLTGEQGVVIPLTNQRNLMLNREVIKAVTDGKFHIWGVSNIDEALSILTGRGPGNLQADGNFPKGSFNEKVVERLNEFNKVVTEISGVSS